MQSLEFRRNGYMEFTSRVAFERFEPDEISALAVLGMSYSFIRLYGLVARQLGLSAPTLFSLTIMPAFDSRLAVPERIRFGVGRPVRTWRENTLELPFILVADPSLEADDVFRKMNDRLWNGFGWDRCFALRDDGAIVTD